jgi:hypothetical protein
MLENKDRIHEDITEAYGEGAKATGLILELVLEALRKLNKDRDLNTLEVTQETAKTPAAGLEDLTIETNETSPRSSLEDLTIEQADRQSKDRSPIATEPERKILFGKGADGFVNNLSPEQETAVGKMLMGKPGETIKGSENLTIRYKGEIIASTNAEGVLEANELYGKIPPETLKKLASAIENTPLANAPVRGAVADKPEAGTTTPAAPVANQPAKPIPKSDRSTETTPVAPRPIEPMAMVPEDLRTAPAPPVRKAPIPSGNPVEQIQNALAKVEQPGNGVSQLIDEIQETAPVAVAADRAIDPQNITGIAAVSKGKAAGLVNWMRENATDPHQLGYAEVKSPNGFIGKIELDDVGDEKYTLQDPQGKVVLAGTLTDELDPATDRIKGSINIDTYDSKGIGKEWDAIKKIPPVEKAEQPKVTTEQLTNLKDYIGKHIKDDRDVQLKTSTTNPDIGIKYEKVDEDVTRYSVLDRQEPTKSISFTHDKRTDLIEVEKLTTTPSMMDIVEKVNAHMQKEQAVLTDEVTKTVAVESRHPEAKAPTPIVPEAQQISTSNIPAQTTQPQAETAKLTQEQTATISKAVVVIDAICEMEQAQVIDLEHTRVSIKDGDKGRKYTVEDVESGERSEFKYDKTTGDVTIVRESQRTTESIDNLGEVFKTGIPGYEEKVQATVTSIGKEKTQELQGADKYRAMDTPKRAAPNRGKSAPSLG